VFFPIFMLFLNLKPTVRPPTFIFNGFLVYLPIVCKL